MKLNITSTSMIVQINGLPCRVWEGTSASGVPVTCFIPLIAPPSKGFDLTEFEIDLHEHVGPSDAARSFPLRMIL